MPRPNIILLLAHQFRWDCAGFSGNPDVRTPNLNALAKHGVHFSQAITQHVSGAPAQTTLLTGLYPGRHGVYDAQTPLDPEIPSLSAVLQRAGYSTALIGATNTVLSQDAYPADFSAVYRPGDTSNANQYLNWLKGQGLRDEVSERYNVPDSEVPERYARTFGAMASGLQEEHSSTKWIGDQAVRFIQSTMEPFFMYVAFAKPHPPYDPPAPWHTLYSPQSLRLPDGFQHPAMMDDAPEQARFDLAYLSEPIYRHVLASYYGAISQMDAQIGRVLATLSGRGHTNNIVIFSADRGDYMGYHGLLHSHAARPYEPRIRVPLIISGILGQRQGVTEPALAELTDIVPTVLDSLRLSIPDSIQGKSLMNQLKHPDVPLRKAAYCEGDMGTRLVRGTQYKLIDSAEVRMKAFYDIERDPCELENLVGNPKTVRQQVTLTKSLRQIR